jgi:hypothetical protein
MEARNGSGIGKKGEGTGIMISAFLTEVSGFLFSEEEFAEFVQRRRQVESLTQNMFLKLAGVWMMVTIQALRP